MTSEDLPSAPSCPPVPNVPGATDQNTLLPIEAALRDGIVPSGPQGYEIQEELGRGGMGVVYRARQIGIGRDVALKMILSGSHAGLEERIRFRREAEAIGKLRHPNIVQIHEVGDHEGKAFLSLELCDGGSLDRHLAGNPIPPETAARLVAQLARGVQHAHDHGIVHRDLKPGNVLLQKRSLTERTYPKEAKHGEEPRVPMDAGPKGRSGDSSGRSSAPSRLLAGSSDCSVIDLFPKITDFGLARHLDEQSHTVSGRVMGTPSYLAPEQARGVRDVTGAVDVWALGAILYECLTGRPPFRAASVHATIDQVIHAEPAGPGQLNPVVPHDLEVICLKCLRKEPGQRYATAGDLGDDLERFLAGEPIVARPVGWVERSAKWVRRNPVIAGLLAAVACSLLVGTLVASLFAVEAHEQALRAERRARDEQRAREAAIAARERETEQRRHAEQQRDRARILLHASRIVAAHRAWEAGHSVRAWQHLDACHHADRGWEHRYLVALLSRGQRVLPGHTHPVTSLATSSDGAQLVSASKEGLRLWDVPSAKQRLLLGGPGQGISSVVFTPDGSRLIRAGWDRLLEIWDLRTGQKVATLPGHDEGIRCLAISPDGQRLASGSEDGVVQVWDPRTGKRLFAPPGLSRTVVALAFDADGGRLSGAGWDGKVVVWDGATGKPVRTLALGVREVDCLAFRPDGRRIVSGGKDGAIQVWDAITGNRLANFTGHAAEVTSVAFAPDGTRIVSGSLDGALRVWDVRGGRESFPLRGHRGPVTSVAFSPDGARVVSGGHDGQVHLWDARRGVGSHLPIEDLFGASRLVYAGNEERLIGDSWDGKLTVREASTGKVIRLLEGHSGEVTDVKLDPSGKCLISGSQDRTARVWEWPGGKERLVLAGHQEGVTSVASGRDGKLLVTGSRDRTVILWEGPSGKPSRILRGHTDELSCLALTPDGSHVVSGSTDQTVRVWRTDSGVSRHTLAGHAGRISALVVAPDGERVYSGSSDGTVRGWSLVSGQLLHVLADHPGGVTSLAMTPDGRRLFSGSGDGTVRIWDTRTGQEVFSFRGHTLPVTCLALRPDGSALLSVSRWETPARLWETNPSSEPGAGIDPTWHREQLEVAEEADDPLARAFHLGWLARGTPWDAGLHVALAHVLARQGRVTDASIHLGRALFLHPRVPLWPIDAGASRRGEEAARAGDWPRAARAFELAAHQPDASPLTWRNLLLAQARAGLNQEVQQTLHRLADLPGASRDANERDLLVATALAVPGDATSAGRLLTWTAKELVRGRTATSLHLHGVALFRAGRHAEAGRVLAGSVEAHGKGGFMETRLFQAQLAWRDRQVDQARRLLRGVEDQAGEQDFPTWQQRERWRLLLRETRTRIEAPPLMPRASDAPSVRGSRRGHAPESTLIRPGTHLLLPARVRIMTPNTMPAPQPLLS